MPEPDTQLNNLEVDHTLLDMSLLDKRERSPGDPKLFVRIDEFSRMLLDAWVEWTEDPLPGE